MNEIDDDSQHGQRRATTSSIPKRSTGGDEEITSRTKSMTTRGVTLAQFGADFKGNGGVRDCLLKVDSSFELIRTKASRASTVAASLTNSFLPGMSTLSMSIASDDSSEINDVSAAMQVVVFVRGVPILHSFCLAIV